MSIRTGSVAVLNVGGREKRGKQTTTSLRHIVSPPPLLLSLSLSPHSTPLPPLPPPHTMSTLEEKDEELKQMQQSFDEYIESSKELEQELESELTKLETSNAKLAQTLTLTQTQFAQYKASASVAPAGRGDSQELAGAVADNETLKAELVALKASITSTQNQLEASETAVRVATESERKLNLTLDDKLEEVSRLQ